MIDNSMLLNAIERTLSDNIGKDEIVQFMNNVPSGSQKEIFSEILHSLYHFISDSDIRAHDEDYDALQKENLYKYFRLIEREICEND